jgi:hypothetical protein
MQVSKSSQTVQPDMPPMSTCYLPATQNKPWTARHSSRTVALMPKTVRMMAAATMMGLSGWDLYLIKAMLETIPSMMGHCVRAQVSV